MTEERDCRDRVTSKNPPRQQSKMGYNTKREIRRSRIKFSVNIAGKKEKGKK